MAHPDDARRAHLASSALELRIAGASYRVIANHLGISKSAAHEYVGAAIRELELGNSDLAKELLQIELERLDQMLIALWPKRAEPRVVDSILRLMERRARMLGTDAPVDMRLGGIPGGAPILSQSHELDLSKLSVEQLGQLEAIYAAATAISSGPTDAIHRISGGIMDSGSAALHGAPDTGHE
jgi:hypothetical protein